jgi:hypothetical protein
MTKATALAILLMIAPAGAIQSPAGLTFSATLTPIKVTVRPGQVVTRQFRLTLDARQPATHFKAHVQDWWRSPDGKQSFYDAPGTLKHSCAKWTSVNPVESSVKAGETLVVRITTKVPVELRSGGYWCALTVDEIPNPLTDPPGVGVRFVASVSTGIFINVDPVELSAKIYDLQVQSEQALLQVRNEGNAPLGVEGRIEFYRTGATAPIATVMIPRRTLLTEPHVEGLFAVALPAAVDLPSGRYRVRAILDIGADHDIGAEREIDVVRTVTTHAPPR